MQTQNIHQTSAKEHPEYAKHIFHKSGQVTLRNGQSMSLSCSMPASRIHRSGERYLTTFPSVTMYGHFPLRYGILQNFAHIYHLVKVVWNA